MPNLKQLMSTGTFGLLETFEPTLSPAIWTSVATGKDPSVHGIRSFDRPDQRAAGGRRLYNSTDRKTKAFWNILTDYGRRVITIGWLATFPAEEINGTMVAQAGTIDVKDVRRGAGVFKPRLEQNAPQQVHPTEREDEVMKILAESEARLEELTYSVFGTFVHPVAPAESRLWEATQFSLRIDSAYAAIATRLIRERDFDLAAVYLGGTDTVAHRFWRYMRPQLYRHPPSPEQIANFGEVIEAYYAYADEVIGDLVKAAGPGATIIVMSDHGMHETNVDNNFGADDALHKLRSAEHGDAPPGIIIASGPGIRAEGHGDLNILSEGDLETVGSVYDITPTLLALLAIPVGDDMQGQVLTQLLSHGENLGAEASTVATHDTPEWRRAQRNRVVVEPDSKEYIEQLKGLGYVEREDAAVP